MLDNARGFLDLVLPQPDGQSSYWNIHWSAPGQNGRKFWDGRAVASAEEAVKTIAWALKGDPKDLYVCMSAQARAEAKTSKRGYQYLKAMRSQQDVVALRSLFIDIDVKDGAYASTKEAGVALKDFITASGLPQPSAMVGSGSGGFHVHWALDKDLSKDEWQILANALAKATQAHGLMCDTQCTVDSARILRIPGTFNHKSEQPKEVKLLWSGKRASLDQVRASLGKYIEASKPALAKAVVSEFSAGLEAKAKPVKIADVARSCNFVKRTLETGGAGNSNPLWLMTSVIANFTEEGAEALHRMSEQHPTYNPVETDALFLRVRDTQQRKNSGWPQCEKIAAFGCAECKTCPLLAQKKSPLNFALPAANDDPKSPLPDNYHRDPDGIIYRRVVDDMGAVQTIKLCSYPFWNAWMSNNPWTLHVITKTERGNETKLDIPTEVITAKDALPKYLGARGIFVSEKVSKILKEFLLSWIQKLQITKDAVISSSPFGWSVIDGKIEGFSYGGRLWMPEGDRPAVNADPYLAAQYTPKGSIAPWKQMAKIVTDQRRPSLDAIIAAAFAAPLVRFTGQTGVMVNAYSSESGIGKTTAMKIAQSVWGDPVRAMQGLDDTTNSVLKKIGDIRHLPLFWDELKTDQQTSKFVNMAFTLTGGREKSRLTSESQLRSAGTWQTMLVSASNDSIIDAMIRVNKSTTAGIYRTFEYTVLPGIQNGDHVQVNTLLGKLNDHHGEVGLEYAKFLGKNWKRIESDMVHFSKEIYANHAFTNEERFWLACIVSIVIGARYSNELGFTDIDADGLFKFLMDVRNNMRGEIQNSPADQSKTIAVSTILTQFLGAMRSRNTLVTNRIWVSPGKPAKDAIKVLTDASKLDHLKVQVGREDHMVRISSTAFSEWMEQRQYSRHAFTKKMESEFGMKKPFPGILGSGTAFSTGTKEYLIELNLADLRLKDIVE